MSVYQGQAVKVKEKSKLKSDCSVLRKMELLYWIPWLPRRHVSPMLPDLIFQEMLEIQTYLCIIFSFFPKSAE